MLFWVVLLCFSLYSEPVVCGLGMVIVLTGVPVYFAGVYMGQKACYVMFPQEDPAEAKLTSSKDTD